MDVKNHGNWGHGLKPGEIYDINCQQCRVDRFVEAALHDLANDTIPVRDTLRRLWNEAYGQGKAASDAKQS